MDEKKEIFQYTYSSSQQKEIKQIRAKYTSPSNEEDPMDRLRRLDQSTTKPGKIVSTIVGIISVLLLGIGMSCTMVWADTMFIPGIVIGIAGIAGIISAYPIFTAITKRKRAKLADEILQLSSELMK